MFWAWYPFGHDIPCVFAFGGLKLYYRKQFVIFSHVRVGYSLYAASQIRAGT